MGKLKRTIKKAAAIFTAAVMSFSTAAPVYAETAPAKKIAVLLPGVNKGTGGSFASKISELAEGEDNIKAIKWSDTAPAVGIETKEMAVARSGELTSNTSAKAWFDATSGTIFIYSNADEVYMNPNCSGLFYNYASGKALSNLETIDLGRADWSQVTNMSHAFYKCAGLKELDLTKFNGTLDSNSKYQDMISESGITTLKLGDSWKFTGPIGMDGNWTKDGTGPYTSYKIEMSGQFGGGTYVRSPGNIQDDSGEIYQAYGDHANNGWEIHNIEDKFTGFCINADKYTSDDYKKDPTLTPAAGAGMIDGYYTREQVDKTGSKLVNGVVGDKIDASKGYLNSDNTGYAPLGNNMKEALITLLYYGPQIYDINTQEGYDNLQHDIWHFTNHYSDSWANADKWSGKTFQSIPNHDSYELYVYVSSSGRQNMITTDSIPVPETPTHEVKILKTAVSASGQDLGTLAKAKLLLRGPKSYRITSGTQAAVLSLPAGDYTLSETEAPAGYTTAEDVKFTVTDDGKIMMDGKEVQQVTMKDVAFRNNVTIRKVDEKGNNVGDAGLKITCKSTVIKATVKPIEFTSKADGTRTASLYPGEYTMSEEIVPTGYEKADPIDFSLDTNGHIFINGKDVGTTITMVDKYKKHTVKISKQDIAGEEIDGAKLTISGDKIDDITFTSSKSAPHSVELPAGTYTLTETTAPKGYAVSESIEFTLKDDGSIVLNGKNGSLIPETTEDTKIDAAETCANLITAGNNITGIGQEYVTWLNDTKYFASGINNNDLKDYVSHALTVCDFASQFSGNKDKIIGTLRSVQKTTLNDYTSKHLNHEQIAKANKLIQEGISVTSVGEDYVTWLNDMKQFATEINNNDLKDYVSHALTVYDFASQFSGNKDKIIGTLQSTLKNEPALSDGNIIVMTDHYADAKFNISKQDVGGKEIKGATLHIEGKTIEGKTFTTSFTTDGEKPHTVSLQPGTYTLTETQVPDGYEKAEMISFEIDKTGKVTVDGKEVSQIVMVDKYAKKPVEISKQDIAGKEIAGATLTVTGTTDQGEDITPITIKTDGKTTHKISVYPGTYVLTETTAPKGYLKAESIQFVVKADGSIVSGQKNVKQIVMVDKFSDETVKISKRDINGNEIAGAKLTITHKENNETVTDYTWVSEEGKNKEVVLSAGDYTLHETGAPDGYVKASDIEFTVTADGSVTVNNKKVDTVVMTDKFTTVTVSKVDSTNTKKFLSGAKLQILDEGKKVVDEWTTDSKAHTVSGLLGVGKKYTLHEVSAPDGYEVADDITFTVTSGTKSVVMKDAAIVRETGDLTVRKVDASSTQKFVSGAKLQLLDADKKVVEEWTTDSKEHIVKAILKKNVTYTLHEETAPSGYEKAADISFTMTEKNKIVIMKDKAIVNTGRVTIQKIKDGDNKTFVEGAKLQILDKDKKVVEEWVTNTSAHIVSAKLVSGQKYTLHEVSAPSGYEVASDITFTASEKDQTITMKDKAVDVPGKVTVMKVKDGEEKTYVPGAKLQVLDASGTAVDEWTTDGSSHIVAGNLKIGQKYTLHEVSAPDGYEVASDITFTVSTKDQSITMKDKESPVLKISKVDEDGKPISGAQLQILDSNNGIIDSWTTDGTDHVVTAKLEKGTYKLHEVAAPNGYEVAEDISFTYPQTDSKTITMTDKKSPAGAKSNGDGSGRSTRSAATGDASNLPLMAAGLALGAAALGFVILKKKKN